MKHQIAASWGLRRDHYKREEQCAGPHEDNLAFHAALWTSSRNAFAACERARFAG